MRPIRCFTPLSLIGSTSSTPHPVASDVLRRMRAERFNLDPKFQFETDQIRRPQETSLSGYKKHDFPLTSRRRVPSGAKSSGHENC
jgi:hypothetical protein